MPGFNISFYFFARLLFATVVVGMDVTLNGRIGATVNRFANEFVNQR